MLLPRHLRYLFRTSMMNCPKGVDLFRVQNQMVELYTPLKSYGLLEIYNRNEFFLRPLASPETPQEVQPEEEKYQINYKPSSKSQSPDPVVEVAKNEDIVEQQRLNNQTLTEFLKQSTTNPQKKHILFYVVIITMCLAFARAYMDTTHPKTVPQRVRSLTPTQGYFFNIHQHSAQLDLVDAKINKFDDRFWKMIQEAKQNN